MSKTNSYVLIPGRLCTHFHLYEHRLVAEEALGHKIPRGAVIHHIDGKPKNNSNQNLVLCNSTKYHHLLHIRERALRACGNKHWRICVYCHQHDDPANMKKPKYGGFYHVKCSSEARQRLRLKRLLWT